MSRGTWSASHACTLLSNVCMNCSSIVALLKTRACLSAAVFLDCNFSKSLHTPCSNSFAKRTQACESPFMALTNCPSKSRIPWITASTDPVDGGNFTLSKALSTSVGLNRLGAPPHSTFGGEGAQHSPQAVTKDQGRPQAAHTFLHSKMLFTRILKSHTSEPRLKSAHSSQKYLFGVLSVGLKKPFSRFANSKFESFNQMTSLSVSLFIAIRTEMSKTQIEVDYMQHKFFLHYFLTGKFPGHTPLSSILEMKPCFRRTKIIKARVFCQKSSFRQF